MKSSVAKDRLRGLALQNEVLRLRMMGLTYDAIAERLGRPKSTVHRAAKRGLERLQRETLEVAAEYRTLQMQRLERMLVGLWPKAIGGDLKRVQAAVNIIREENRLMGLYEIRLGGDLTISLEWPDAPAAPAAPIIEGAVVNMEGERENHAEDAAPSPPADGGAGGVAGAG